MTTTRRAVDYRIDPFDLHLSSAVIAHGTITAAAETVNPTSASLRTMWTPPDPSCTPGWTTV